MRLPNSARAVVDIAKLRDYCLNESHPRGRHKARMFASALNVTAKDAENLRVHILAGVAQQDAIAGVSDDYGARYTVDMPIEILGRKALVRTAWIVRRDEDFPRLTSCFIL